MKQVEKLAEQYAKGTDDKGCCYGDYCTTNDYHEEVMEEAFQAGFRKARELIIKHLREEVGPGSPETLGVTESFGDNDDA